MFWAAAVVVCALLLAGGVGFLAGQGLDKADQWANIGSFVIAFVVGVPALLASIIHLRVAFSQLRTATPDPPQPGKEHHGEPARPERQLMHRRRRHLAGVLALVLLLIVGPTTGVLAALPPPANPTCPHPVQLNVLTSLEKERVLRNLAADFERRSRRPSGEGCKEVSVYVSRVPSADVAITSLSQSWPSKDLHEVGPEPHVWIPDASSDYEQVQTALGVSGAPDIELEHRGSIAVSPLVLAMPAENGTQLPQPDQTFRWGDVRGLAEQGVSVIGRTNPRSSSAGMAATVALYRDVLGVRKVDAFTLTTLEAARRLNEVEKWIPVGSEETGKLLCSLRQAPVERANRTAVLVSEKAVHDYNRGVPVGDACGAGSPPTVQLSYWYATDGTPFLDHPFIAVKWKNRPQNQRRQQVVAEFLSYLTAPEAQGMLMLDGLRDRSGRIGNVAGAWPSKPPELAGALDVELDADALLDAWEGARKPARVLVAVDVSKSMAEPFGRVGSNRIRAAGDAIGQSLRLIGTRDRVGLWSFARQLDGQRGHRELVALGDGQARRAPARNELDKLQPMPQEASLYDTIQAAVNHLRTARAGNELVDETNDAVVVVADGRDNGLGQISAAELADFLGTAGGKPVQVFVIAFAEAICSSFELQQITQEAGGGCFEVGSALDISRALDGVATGLWGGDRVPP